MWEKRLFKDQKPLNTYIIHVSIYIHIYVPTDRNETGNITCYEENTYVSCKPLLACKDRGCQDGPLFTEWGDTCENEMRGWETGPALCARPMIGKELMQLVFNRKQLHGKEQKSNGDFLLFCCVVCIAFLLLCLLLETLAKFSFFSCTCKDRFVLRGVSRLAFRGKKQGSLWDPIQSNDLMKENAPQY